MTYKNFVPFFGKQAVNCILESGRKFELELLANCGRLSTQQN